MNSDLKNILIEEDNTKVSGEITISDNFVEDCPFPYNLKLTFKSNYDDDLKVVGIIPV